MSSPRLTEAIRSSITDKLIDRAYADRHKALAQRSNELIERVATHLFGGAANRELAENMPSDWFRSVETVFVDHCQLNSYTTVLLPYLDGSRSFDGSELSSEISLDVRDFYNEKEALEKEERNTWREINSVLRSVTTTKKLYEIWPELQPVVLDEPTPSAGALVPNLDALNAKLGLSKASA